MDVDDATSSICNTSATPQGAVTLVDEEARGRELLFIMNTRDPPRLSIEIATAVAVLSKKPITCSPQWRIASTNTRVGVILGHT